MPRRYPSGNVFKSMENLIQKWWYFEFNENGSLRLANKNKFKHRPSDANPDQGNPYTPWYQVKDHYDNDHIHIKATNHSMAFKKANAILQASKLTM